MLLQHMKIVFPSIELRDSLSKITIWYVPAPFYRAYFSQSLCRQRKTKTYRPVKNILFINTTITPSDAIHTIVSKSTDMLIYQKSLLQTRSLRHLVMQIIMLCKQNTRPKAGRMDNVLHILDSITCASVLYINFHPRRAYCHAKTT